MSVSSNQSFLELRKAVLDKEYSRMNAMQKQAVFHTEGLC